MKAIVYLLNVAIVLSLSIALISSGVSAQESDDSGLSAKPIIFVLKGANDGLAIDYYNSFPVIYSDTGNATLWVIIRMPYQVYDAKGQDTVMWLGGHLTQVSYKASWQNNQTVNLNPNNANKGELDFNLTNIPYGNQTLEVNASCVVQIMDNWEGASHPFYDNNTKSVSFAVAPNPTPNPTLSPNVFSLNLEQAVPIVAVATAVIVISVVFYIKHKKSTTAKSL